MKEVFSKKRNLFFLQIIFLTLFAIVFTFSFRKMRDSLPPPEINQTKIVGYTQYFGYPSFLDIVIFLIFIFYPIMFFLLAKFFKK